jgi:glycosyltransferase involved in cell wall biosynthesis
VLFAETGSGYGGSARYLVDLLPLLDRSRYEPQLLASADGPLVRAVREQGVPVTCRPSWRLAGVQELAGGRLVRYARFAAMLARHALVTIPAAWWWLRRERVGLVHANNELLTSLPLLAAARLAGCRTVCHLQGWRPLTRLERAAAGCVDVFICVSHVGAAYHQRQLGGRAVVPILHAVSLNVQADPERMAAKRRDLRRELGIPDDAILAALVGRVIPWKGQEVFVRALGRAAGRAPSVRGLIVGHDPSEGQTFTARLREVAREAGATDRLQFVAWQSDVWAVYAAADVVVHASTQPEPFGLVITEAMGAGRPVIATRAGGVVDIVQHEQTGLLVAPGSDEEMAEAIVRLAGDRALAARLGQAAQRRVREAFSMPRNAEEVAAVYERVLKRSQEGSG